jgi:CBS domain-containing protein
MNRWQTSAVPDTPFLDMATAAEVMTGDPVSVPAEATLTEVLAFLADKGYSAAPVIDQAGRPIGVVSRTDFLVHERKQALSPPPSLGTGPPQVGQVRARELMTPAVFTVKPETPVPSLAEQMVELNVHRLFVVDESGVLVGVVTALDLLRYLCRR